MSIRNVAVCIAAGGFLLSAHAADTARAGIETQVIVTVADHMNHKPPVLHKEDIAGTSAMRIASVEPLTGSKELYILIDDAANYDFGNKLEELRSFVNIQPPWTEIGVAFITGGELKIAQPPVNDHQLVDRTLRAPSGTEPANPWCAVARLLSQWPASTARREVLIVTSGMGRPDACADPDAVIAQAQRAGMSIFAIYHPVAGYESQEWRHVDAGVVELAHVCYETGGEAYFISHGPMETIAPFLDDVSEHLANQYLITVFFDPGPEPGFRDVILHGASNALELMAPAKVWVGR